MAKDADKDDGHRLLSNADPATRIKHYIDATTSNLTTKQCITRLREYRAVRTCAQLPRGSSAAVLVPLFVGRSGDLYVLLSRRSDALKAFAGDTALPGGKMDVEDRSMEDTARREAFEEIGLPQDKERVPLLCVMEPHLAKGVILVTPVVVLILDRNLQPNLNSSEVTSIFAQPLVSFLSSTPHLSGNRTADATHPYHTFADLPWSDGGTVRLHRFLTGREIEGVKPVFGLTAAILIKSATIGYGRTPDFEVQPPNAPTLAQQIAYALLTPANPIRIACEQEGIDPNETAARVLRPSAAVDAPRTIEWAKIGAAWKRLLEHKKASTRVDNRTPDGRHSDGRDVSQSHVGRRVQGKVNGSGSEQGAGPGKLEMRKDLATVGAFLDETRDRVDKRMKDVKGDERKLAEAREGYPKIVEQVKKRIAGPRGEDGEFDPKALFPLMFEEDPEGLEDGTTAGKGVVEGGKGVGEEIYQGVQKGKEGSEEIKCKLRKRDAKL